MDDRIWIIFILLLVLQMMGAALSFRALKWFKYLLEVHAAIGADAKVVGYLAYSTLLRIKRNNGKGDAEADDEKNMTHQIEHMVRDLCVNSGIDPRKYDIKDMSGIAYDLFKRRDVHSVSEPHE